MQCLVYIKIPNCVFCEGEACGDCFVHLLDFIGPVKQLFFRIELRLFSYPPVQTCVLGAQKNRLIKTVLCTHNICFG